MASRGIMYRGVTESAWPSVREIIRKFETLGLESRRSANNANQSSVANGMPGPKESERGEECPSRRPSGALSSVFGKQKYDCLRMASEITSKLTYVVDDTSFVCPCCQRCYRCPIAEAAKAAGYNKPCTGRQPGDLSAQFGRETCDGRRMAPETIEKLSDVLLDDSSFECPRCRRNHRCPFIVAAKASRYNEPCTGRQPGGLSVQFGKETCGGRRTVPETAAKSSDVLKDSSLVCPRCQRRYRCPFGAVAKAPQNTDLKGITLCEEAGQRSNGTDGFPHGVTSELSLFRRPAGFVRRSIEKIEALLLCKK